MDAVNEMTADKCMCDSVGECDCVFIVLVYVGWSNWFTDLGTAVFLSAVLVNAIRAMRDFKEKAVWQGWGGKKKRNY